MIDLFIASPDQKIFEGRVRKVSLPTTTGTISVLAGHEPVISTIDFGEVIFEDENEIRNIAAFYGVVNIENSKGKTRVSVLLENTEDVKNIDLERAKAAHERVKTAMKEKDDLEFDLNSNLMRELNRIKLSKKYTNR